MSPASFQRHPKIVGRLEWRSAFYVVPGFTKKIEIRPNGLTKVIIDCRQDPWADFTKKEADKELTKLLRDEFEWFPEDGDEEDFHSAKDLEHDLND